MAVFGWLCCCCCGSWTAPFPTLCPPPGAPGPAQDPAGAAWLASLPSKGAGQLDVLAFSAVTGLGEDWEGLPLGVLNFSDSLLAALPGETVCFAVGTFEPGFGIPLEDGIKLSFLAAVVLLPFGMKLAILEVFFGATSVTGSLSSLTGFSVQTLFLSLFFSSFSFGCSKDFLLLRFLLPAFGGANFGDTLGLLLVELPPFRPLLEPSTSPDSGKASSSLPPSPGPELGGWGGRNAARAFTSLNFSSMDFCPEGAVLTPSEAGGFSLSAGGVGEVAGLDGFTVSMVEVALCLAFMDLLRQGLLVLGDGMAEAGGCPAVPGGCMVPFTPEDG